MSIWRTPGGRLRFRPLLQDMTCLPLECLYLLRMWRNLYANGSARSGVPLSGHYRLGESSQDCLCCVSQEKLRTALRLK